MTDRSRRHGCRTGSRAVTARPPDGDRGVCGLRRAQPHGVCTVNRLPSVLVAPAKSLKVAGFGRPDTALRFSALDYCIRFGVRGAGSVATAHFEFIVRICDGPSLLALSADERGRQKVESYIRDNPAMSRFELPLGDGAPTVA